MRLSELLHMRAVDDSGKRLGHVRDLEVTFVKGERARRLEVAGVLYGGGKLAERFGYFHGPVRGPWLLARLLTRKRNQPRSARWTGGVRIEGDRLVIPEDAGTPGGRR